MNTSMRWLLAFSLSALIYIGWFRLFPPPEAPPVDDPTAQSDDPGATDGGTPAPDAAEAPTSDGVDPAAGEVDPGSTGEEGSSPSAEVVHASVSTELLSLGVSNERPHRQGIIRSIEMLAPRFQGHVSGSDAFSLGQSATLEVAFADEQTDFRIPREQNFEVLERSNTHFVLGYVGRDVEIRETLEVSDGYAGRLTVELTNRSNQTLAYKVKTRTRVGAGQSQYDVRRGLCYTGEDLEAESADDAEDGPIRFAGPIRWAASDTKYFTTAVIPEEPGSACIISEEGEGERVVTTLVSSLQELPVGKTNRHVYDLYIGAKELEGLKAYQDGKADLEKAIDWGYLGIVSGTLGPLLLQLLRWVHGWVNNWGWSILVLTVIIKAITLPLTLKQMASMKRMKDIQPEMAKIKEKYGDDRAKQGQEMQALFSRSGVNPLAGCLPMLVQLPVWFALYSMLLTAVELVHEPFLWLPDLTEADPYFITPVAMTGVMVLQNRMMPVTDETQAKLMRTIMPLMFGGMMLFLPAGLGVYIFTNVLLSAVQSAIQLRSTDDGESPEKEAKK